jgi:hypothetical protein
LEPDFSFGKFAISRIRTLYKRFAYGRLEFGIDTWEPNLDANLQSSTPKAETPEIRVPVGAMLAERRALKQAREKVRIQGEAILLQRKLLQMREEQIKVQANRIAELENMIGLRTSAVPMLMNEPFMRNLDKKVS